MSLSQKHCVPCTTASAPLKRSEFAPLALQVPAWQIVEDRRLHRELKLKDFAESLALANRIGAIAEAEGHHPDLLVRWGELIIDIWTHKVGGLTEADFVLAAKIDELSK